MTRAIFIDRKHKLTRCQLLGMNQKGEPEWLVIEQGMESKTLAAIQREDFIDHKYGMLCLEGEKLDKLILMAKVGIKKRCMKLRHTPLREFLTF